MILLISIGQGRTLKLKRFYINIKSFLPFSVHFCEYFSIDLLILTQLGPSSKISSLARSVLMGILSVFASCQNTKTIFMLRDINFPILLILILAQEVMKPKLLEDCKY